MICLFDMCNFLWMVCVNAYSPIACPCPLRSSVLAKPLNYFCIQKFKCCKLTSYRLASLLPSLLARGQRISNMA